MTSTDVEREKTRFHTDASCQIMLGQGQAIKYGRTLVGSETNPCYLVCFFENDYSLDTRTQCGARPQGAHQQMPVHIWGTTIPARLRRRSPTRCSAGRRAPT